MELTLKIAVARRREGLWEATMPWVGRLEQPIRGPHRTAVEEEVVHRVVELVSGRFPPADLPRLLPPEDLSQMIVDVAIRRQIAEDRPPVEMTADVPVLMGHRHDGLYHLWFPTAPGEAIAVRSFEEIWSAVQTWAFEWAEERGAEDLSALKGGEHLRVAEVDVDLGELIEPGGSQEQTRLTRPEALEEVATNLTHLAAEGTTDRAWGREEVVDELVDAMTGSRASHICLVGPSGTGKSAVIEEAVRRSWELQQSYQKRRDVWRSSGDQMIAGMSLVGQWQERAKRVCRELNQRGDILAIDELYSFVHAGPGGGHSNLARFLEPELTQGRFSTVAEATERTLDRARNEAPGFVEAFRRVHLPPMDLQETFGAANAFVRDLEEKEPVAFTPRAVEAAVELCDRYIRDEAFPGKAVRLLRRCARDAKRDHPHKRDRVGIGRDFVAEVVRRETGLPERVVSVGAGRSSEEARRSFEGRVFGQPEASEAVSDLVVAIEQGLCDPERPLANLLLIGPSGVGKTETAKALADEVFGSADRLVRFDMSEFAEPGAATRLIGSRASPDGELTGRIRVQPYTVLLFDEIEKAHRSVLDLLLQLLDDGRLTDAAGRTVDFTNTVVAMTSNLGADEEGRETGFTADDDRDRAIHYRRAAEDFFRPEFFNRIDRLISYRPLGPGTLRRIARRALGEILDRRGLRQPRVMVDVAPELVEHLITGAVDRRYGARTLKQRIERELLSPLAREMIRERASDELTRVTIVPHETRGIELKLHSLEPADRVEVRDPMAGLDLEAQIEAFVGKVVETDESAEMQEVERRRDRLLEAFNEESAAGQEAALERAEELRQLDVVRQQRDDLHRRLRELLGEGAPDEIEMPDIEGFDRTREHQLSNRLAELRDHMIWLSCQLQAATAKPVDSSTLIVEGLSGPTDPILEAWTRLVGAFSDVWEIEIAIAARREEEWQTWRRGDFEETAGDTLDLIALSAEHPGAGALFGALTGYVWAPKPPTHGRHALALASTIEEGVSDDDELRELLERRRPTSDPAGHRVEYRLGEGKLRDVRLDTEQTIPDKAGRGWRDFARQVLLRRLALVVDRGGEVVATRSASQKRSVF